MKRYHVFEPVSSLIYLGPLVALLGLSVLAWQALIPVAVWAFVASRFFWPRYQTKKRISFYTSGGWAVITNGAPVESFQISRNITQALDWWTAHKYAPDSPVSDVGEGGFIVVEATDDGFYAPGVAGMVGVRAPGTIRMREMTDGNRIKVVWEPKNNGRDFYALLRHGVGHAVLNAWNETGDHHAIMRTLNCPDA